jgi:imidazolonepropionase-like amidohydrolase
MASMDTLYSGGLVFDGERALPGQGVLVKDGRIAEIGPLDSFAGFAGRRVDTAGGTLLPGLIDCHVHLCSGAEADPGSAQDKLRPGDIVMRALERAQVSLAGGIIALRDCGGRDYLELSVRDAVNQGRAIGPTIRAVGRMICMTGGHGNRIARVADGVDDVVRAVREQIHAGADWIKIMATGGVMTPGVNPEDAHYSAAEMAAGVAEGKRFNRKTASHAQGAEGILNAVRGGVTSIEHGIFMNEACVAEMLAMDVYLVPTLAAVKHILEHKAQGIASYVVEKAERAYDRHRQAVTMYYKAGGKIAMGTDAGTPFNRHGENARELAYMVEVGMAPVDSIKAATQTAATMLDLTDRGRVAKGLRADLLIVNGDPTRDIAMVADKANHRAVIKDGVMYQSGSVTLPAIAGRIGRLAAV